MRPVLEVGGQLLGHLVGRHAHGDLDPGRTQGGDASAGHPGIGVLDADHDPGDARLDDGVGAGRGPPLVGARLEGGVQRGPPGRLARPGPGRSTSACGPPGGAVAPSNVVGSVVASGVALAGTTTLPTQGFGVVLARTVSASASARRMCSRSSMVTSSLGRHPAGSAAIIEHVPVFVEKPWSGQPTGNVVEHPDQAR